jgi:hypothetical protein
LKPLFVYIDIAEGTFEAAVIGSGGGGTQFGTGNRSSQSYSIQWKITGTRSIYTP